MPDLPGAIDFRRAHQHNRPALPMLAGEPLCLIFAGSGVRRGARVAKGDGL